MSRNNSRGAVGALHPILFFVFVYGISLALSFFICNVVYHNMQVSTAISEEALPTQQATAPASHAEVAITAMR
jgi:hypothetical protein